MVIYENLEFIEAGQVHQLCEVLKFPCYFNIKTNPGCFNNILRLTLDIFFPG